MTVLVVVVPIPLFGALGLSLPLPATVERLAARLVPFGNAAVLDSPKTDVLAHGSIILAAAESGGSATPASSAAEPAASNATTGSEAHGVTTHPVGDTAGPVPGDTPRTVHEGGADALNTTPGKSAPAAPAAGGSTSNPGGSDPAPAPTPTPTPTPAPAPSAPQVVGTVTTTATSAVSAATATTKAVVDNTKPTVPGTAPGLPQP